MDQQFETNSISSFVKSLIGLSEKEMTKAKELFIRNEISKLKSGVDNLENNNAGNWIFWLIPIFWPMLNSWKKSGIINLIEDKDKIYNALHVWKDELSYCYNELIDDLNNIQIKEK